MYAAMSKSPSLRCAESVTTVYVDGSASGGKASPHRNDPRASFLYAYSVFMLRVICGMEYGIPIRSSALRGTLR